MELKAGFKQILWIILVFVGPGALRAGDAAPQEQPLSEVLDQISEKYQVIITYNSRLLSDINVDFEFRAEEQLETAVNRVLVNTGLKYKQLTEKYYIVFKEARTNKNKIRKIQRKLKQIQKLEQEENISVQNSRNNRRGTLNAIFETADELLKEKNISGTVVDDNDTPLIGVNVLVKGSGQGTVTDYDGKFSITVADDVEILLFSYTGFQTQEIAIENRTEINVRLLPATEMLGEVVVVGYGQQERKSITGAVSTVGAEEINEIPAANLSSLLAGRASGVFITQSGGKPGRTSSVRIRQGDTFSGGTTPLFVIDGVISDQFAFDGLDPTEVESITVLKDGASAAVYGARAANGVIVVTTKQGVSGKPRINYIFNTGIEDATKIPETFTAYEHAGFINSSLENQGVDPSDPAYFSADELDYFKTHSYDFIEQLYKQPITNKHAVNLSGGTDAVRYFVGGSYYTATGSFDNLEFNRYNLRAKVDANVNADLKFSLNLATDTRNDEKPFWRWDGDNDDFVDLYRNSLLRNKFSPAYIDGLPVGNNLAWHPGEVVNGNTGYNRKRWTNYNAILGVEYNVPFLEGLQFRATYNHYNRNDYRKELNTPYDLYLFETSGENNHIIREDATPTGATKTRNDGDWVQERSSYDRSYQLNLYLNFDRQFGLHRIGALAVYEQAENTSNNFYARRNFLLSQSIDQLFGASSDSKDSQADGGAFESARLSYVGRLNYSFNDMLYLETTLRADGSLIFPENGRWGYFPAASVAFRLSKLPAFQETFGFISEFKLRASIANIGNDNISPWQYQQNYSIGGTPVVFNGSVADVIQLGSLPISDLTWEKKRSINYGFDAYFFENKINASLDIFSTRRTDILGSREASVPTTFGGNLPPENYGIMTSSGFEFDLGYRNRVGDDFRYQFSFNFGYATNKVVQRDEPANFLDYQQTVGYNSDRIWGLVADDIIRTQADLDALPEGYTILGQAPALGMLNYVDLRGPNGTAPDGKIDDWDRQYIADHSQAPIAYGFTLGGSWKGFSINAFFQGFAGHQKMVGYLSKDNGLEGSNFAIWRDYWTPENTDATMPRAWGWGDVDIEGSTFWLRDADFLRLRNLNIGYDLPAGLTERIGLEGVNIFFNGVNLFLLQDKIKDFDPEGNINLYPITKSMTFGVNVKI